MLLSYLTLHSSDSEEKHKLWECAIISKYIQCYYQKTASKQGWVIRRTWLEPRESLVTYRWKGLLHRPTSFTFFQSNKENIKSQRKPYRWQNKIDERIVNSDRTKAMHILQAMYTPTRYFWTTKLHYARNVHHMYKRYAEKSSHCKKLTRS